MHIASNQLGNRPKLEAIFRRIAESIHQFPLIQCQRKQMCTCLKHVCSLQRCTKIGIFCLPAFPVPSKHQKPGSEWGKPGLAPKSNEASFSNPVSWPSYTQTVGQIQAIPNSTPSTAPSSLLLPWCSSPSKIHLHSRAENIYTSWDGPPFSLSKP